MVVAIGRNDAYLNRHSVFEATGPQPPCRLRLGTPTVEQLELVVGQRGFKQPDSPVDGAVGAGEPRIVSLGQLPHSFSGTGP